MTMKERFENKVTVARCAVAGVAVSAPLASALSLLLPLRVMRQTR